MNEHFDPVNLVSRVDNLTIQRMRPTILRFDSLPSTNTEAARQAMRGASEGLCIVALEQTAGRGRRQRVWASPKAAGLYLSIVLRPRIEINSWPLITLMTSLVVADGLFEAFGFHADIKWPNDLLVSGRKVSGILAETIETDQGRAAIVGIGVNLNANTLPEELRDVATSIEEVTGHAPDAEELLRLLLLSFSRRYNALHQASGPEEMLKEWTTCSSYSEGTRVRVSLDDEIVEGVTRGLASDGALRVETDTGEIRLVRAGDITAVRGAQGATPLQ